MERVDPERAVVVVGRIFREPAMEVRDTGLALVKDRAVEDRHPFDVEHDFGQSRRRFKEFIGLEAANRGERIIRMALGYRNDVVRLRIELEFTLEKILENKLVAE